MSLPFPCPHPQAASEATCSGPSVGWLSGDHREGPLQPTGTPSWGIPLDSSWKLETPLPQQQAALGLRSHASGGHRGGKGQVPGPVCAVRAGGPFLEPLSPKAAAPRSLSQSPWVLESDVECDV